MNLDQFQTEVRKTAPAIDADLLARYYEANGGLSIALTHLQMELDSVLQYFYYIFRNKPLPEALKALVEVTPGTEDVDTGKDHAYLRLLHGLIGTLDVVSTHIESVGPAIFEGDAADLDYDNTTEDLGEQLWYVCLMAEVCNVHPVGGNAEDKYPPNLSRIATSHVERMRHEVIDNDVDAENEAVDQLTAVQSMHAPECLYRKAFEIDYTSGTDTAATVCCTCNVTS